MTEILGDNIDENVKGGLEETKAESGPGNEYDVIIVDDSEGEKGEDAAKINEEVEDSFKVKVGKNLEEMAEESCKLIGDVSTENTTVSRIPNSVGATGNFNKANNAGSAESNTTVRVNLADDVVGNKLVCENEGEIVINGKDGKKIVDATEQQDGGSAEEMINLPDTFFDDLMDAEFLGFFDVVDSWKQDDDIAEGGKGKEKYCERNEKDMSSKYEDKGRRMHDNDRNRSARSSRNERRRSRGRDWYDRNRWKDGRSRYGWRSDRSRSCSKKEGTDISRPERARSRQRRERSSSTSRKKSSCGAGRRSMSRPGSVSKQRRDRSTSRSRKERRNSKLKNESSSRNSVENKEKKHVEDQNEKDRPASPKRDVQLTDTCVSLNTSGEPPPPGLEDLVPPGEEPLLIRSYLETSEKDTNFNQEKLDKGTPKENFPNDESLPVGKPKLQPEDKNETNSSVKQRDYNVNMKRKSGAATKQNDEAVRNQEMTQRLKEYDGVSKRDMTSSNLSQRSRCPADVEMRHPRHHRRSLSNEREPRDRSWYKTRERPVDSDPNIERDIRHFIQLRRLEKEEREKYTDLDPESIQSWKDHKDRSDYYPSRERYRSPSVRLSLSPVSLSPTRSKFSRSHSRPRPLSRSRSRSRKLSHSHRRSRDYRHRSRSALSDSLRSLSFSSLSSENDSRSRRHPQRLHRKYLRRQPFFEEIAQKLGIQTNSQEYPQRHHEMAGGPQQLLGPYSRDQLPQQQQHAPFSLPSIHVPPPNLAVPPPMHVPGPGLPPMVGLPPLLQGGPPCPPPVPGGPFQQMQFTESPAPMLGPVSNIIPVPFTQSLPADTAPAQRVFSVEPTGKESRSLASYLEASLKGDAEVTQLSRHDKHRKADEDSKLLSCVKLEVVTRCEEAVVAVRAENSLSMAPLGRVIIQPKVPGSSVSYCGDQVSCFRSPLFDLSNPSFSFTTPPLHDFVSRDLKTAARKLRRSEQSWQESPRNAGTTLGPAPGDGTRRSSHSQFVSIGVNTQISCVIDEWCCKCQAYNVGGAASHSSTKLSDRDAAKRKQSGHRWEKRGHRNSRGENRDGGDVQILGASLPASQSQSVPGPTEQPEVLPGNRAPEHPAVFPVMQPPRHSGSGAVASTVSYPLPDVTHPVFMPAAVAFRGMSIEQIQRFSSRFAESQRRFQESVRNANS